MPDLTPSQVRDEISIALRNAIGTFDRDISAIVSVVNDRLNPLNYRAWYDFDRAVLVAEPYPFGGQSVSGNSEEKFVTDNDLIGGTISLSHNLENPVDVTVYDANGVKFEAGIETIGTSIVRIDLSAYQPLQGRWLVLIEK